MLMFVAGWVFGGDGWSYNTHSFSGINYTGESFCGNGLWWEFGGTSTSDGCDAGMAMGD